MQVVASLLACIPDQMGSRLIQGMSSGLLFASRVDGGTFMAALPVMAMCQSNQKWLMVPLSGLSLSLLLWGLRFPDVNEVTPQEGPNESLVTLDAYGLTSIEIQQIKD